MGQFTALVLLLGLLCLYAEKKTPRLQNRAQPLPLLDDGPLVSVIITVYNVESYLLQCLDSIMDQTYKNLEIIVIDDHSVDNSTQVIRNAQLQDRRIVPVFLTYTSFGGTSTGSNLGINMAKGEHSCLSCLSPLPLYYIHSLCCRHPSS